MTQPDNLIRDGRPCGPCRGTGDIPHGRTCPDCDGDGVIWDDPWAEDYDEVVADETRAAADDYAEWDRAHDRWVDSEVGL